MFLLIAITMGCLTASNAWVETQVRTDMCAVYANPTLGRLSSLGGLASWACVIPAAYFYSASDFDMNLWKGLLFCSCALLGGPVLTTLIMSRYLRYLVSPFVLFVNPALACLAYAMSTH